MTETPRRDSRIEIFEKSTPYEGYFQVDVYRFRHTKFEGGWTGELKREIHERGHAAAVLLYDPAPDAVVLIEQFRIGAHVAGLEPWLVEIVAGIIEPGEDAAEVARREAIEEAGCEIDLLEPIGAFLMSQGGSTETVAVFCGRIDSAGAGGIHGLDHEGEDIRVLVLPTDEALERLQSGGIVNATAAIALQWLALNRDRLRAEWS